MSTQPQSADALEQARRQIQQLALEVDGLSKQDLPSDTFWSEFLKRLIAAMSAVGGAVWILRDDRLTLVYQIEFPADEIRPGTPAVLQHDALLRRAVDSGSSLVLRPRSVDSERGAGNPTRHILILSPLLAAGKVEGVVEVFQRANTAPETHEGFRRFADQMCDRAGRWVVQQKLQEYRAKQDLGSRVDDLAYRLHRTLDLKTTVYEIANEGRRLIECDRLSVAVRRGRRLRVMAISGVDSIEPRSMIAVLMARLVQRVVATGEALWFTGDTEGLAPQLAEPLMEFVDETVSRTVVIVPLLAERKEGVDALADSTPPMGALVIEHIQERRLKEHWEKEIKLLVRHSERALANALEHHQIFLLPLWKMLGRARVVVSLRNLPRFATILGALLAVVLLLRYVPAEIRLRANGQLESAARRQLYAPMDAVVVKLLVQAGQRVSEGDPLLELRSPALEAQIAASEVQLQSVRDQLRRREQEAGDEGDELARLRDYEALVRQQMESRRAQEKLLIVRSPLTGRVSAWDTSQEWAERPVSTGQKLLTVFDPAGPWELNLRVREDSVGPIDQARQVQQDGLPVSFLRLGVTEAPHRATVHNVADWTDADPRFGNAIQLTAAVEGSLAEARPGEPVVARIHCGRSSLGYAWFHELLHFLRARAL